MKQKILCALLAAAMLFALGAGAEGYAATPVIQTEQTRVEAATVEEFLAAIASDREIILTGELYDLSEAVGYAQQDGACYRWGECFDGVELTIENVTNLTIRGEGEDCTAHVITATPRYANVLCFVNCANIQLAGFTAGHTKEPGTCAGGVLRFWNSQDILVQGCGLFGCGVNGVWADNSARMQILENDIYECSRCGVELGNCDDVNIDGNTFRDLGGGDIQIYGCGTVTCNGESVRDFSPRQ